jgi:hypothetical protein
MFFTAPPRSFIDRACGYWGIAFPKILASARMPRGGDGVQIMVHRGNGYIGTAI